MKWTAEDIRVASVLEAGLGPVRVVDVIKHKENRMTDVTGLNAPEDDGGWAEATGANAPAPVTFPQMPDNPNEAPLSVNFKPGGTPQLTVRGRTVAEHMDLLRQVQTSGLLEVISGVSSAFGGSGGAPQQAANFANPQGSFAPTAPPFGPNVSVPGAPGYQGPAQPAAPQWGAPQQQGGFGGGGQQGQGNKPQPKAQPPGWYRTDKNSGPGADFWKNWREQNQGSLKGKISWGGGSTFWVAPDVAQMVNAAGFIVVAA